MAHTTLLCSCPNLNYIYMLRYSWLLVSSSWLLLVNPCLNPLLVLTLRQSERWGDRSLFVADLCLIVLSQTYTEDHRMWGAVFTSHRVWAASRWGIPDSRESPATRRGVMGQGGVAPAVGGHCDTDAATIRLPPHTHCGHTHTRPPKMTKLMKIERCLLTDAPPRTHGLSQATSILPTASFVTVNKVIVWEEQRAERAKVNKECGPHRAWQQLDVQATRECHLLLHGREPVTGDFPTALCELYSRLPTTRCPHNAINPTMSYPPLHKNPSHLPWQTDF